MSNELVEINKTLTSNYRDTLSIILLGMEDKIGVEIDNEVLWVAQYNAFLDYLMESGKDVDLYVKLFLSFYKQPLYKVIIKMSHNIWHIIPFAENRIILTRPSNTALTFTNFIDMREELFKDMKSKNASFIIK